MNLFKLPELSRSGSDEVYTPPGLFDLLGLRFDLDVCAPPGGIPWIPAARHFSILDDGLAMPWGGLVWCNPPYSNASPWVRKFIEHGNGIILVPLCRSRACVELWDAADAVCIPSAFNITGDPVHFLKDGKKKLVKYAVFLAAFGLECSEALRKVGHARIHQKRVDVALETLHQFQYEAACETGWDCGKLSRDGGTK